MEQKASSKIIARNGKAYFNFEILHTYEAGIVLEGWEVKSIRANKVNFQGSYCLFRGDEIFVCNLHVKEYKFSPIACDELRDKKLLLGKQQIKQLRQGIEIKGLTIVPTKLLWSSTGYIKLEVALARGKTKGDKREIIKARDEKRLNEKYIKGM